MHSQPSGPKNFGPDQPYTWLPEEAIDDIPARKVWPDYPEKKEAGTLVSVCMYVCVCVYIYIYIYIYIYKKWVRLYVIHAYMYIYIYIYICCILCERAS